MSGSDGVIELERDGEVFVLRMENGENRFNEAFLADLHAALDRVEAHEGPAALVTTGAGKFYSNGLDLAGFARGEGDPARVLAELDRLFARLLCFPVMTVAAQNGHAFAAGGMMALAHDFRVMRADRGWFCLPEIDLGMGQPLSPGMYAVIGAKLPRTTFHEALVTGRRYGAEEAVRRQIAHESRPGDEVVPRAIELVRGFTGRDRATLAALKRGLYESALAVLEGGRA